MPEEPPADQTETGFEADLLVSELLSTIALRALGESRAFERARMVRREIVAVVRRGGEPARLTIEALLEKAEEHAGCLASSEGSARRASARGLLILEDDLRALAGPTAEAEGLTARPALIEAAAELAWVSGHLAEISPSSSDEAHSIDRIDERLLELRGRLVEGRGRLLIEETDRGLSPTELITRMERVILLRSELADVAGTSTSAGETAQALLERRAALRRAAEDPLRALQDPVARHAWCAALAEALADCTGERLAGLEDHGLEAIVQICTELHDDLVWLEKLLHEKDKAAHDPTGRLPRALRRLRRLRRRLTAELEERQVQLRVESWIGRRSAAALERSILALILGVVGMLIIEGCFELSPPWPHIMAAIDLSICVVFLAEYALKTAASPTPWRYARRHFLLDFVPSIPYGVMLHLSGFDIARSARAIRLARLPRLARYLRTLRPLIRGLRLLGFALRGLDRLIRRHATLLNINVVLFEKGSSSTRRPQGPQLEAAAQRCRGRLADLSSRLEVADQLEIVTERLDHAAEVIDRDAAPARVNGEEALVEPTSREIGFHSLVELLSTLDASLVRAALGFETAQRIQSLLRCLDVPLLRSLPLVRGLSAGVRRLDPFEATAQCGRAIGSFLGSITRAAQVIGDLWGVVTAPRMLDRIGTALAMAAKRPAMRLLIFGTLFLLLQLIVEGLGWTGLEALTSWITRIVGAPLLILGTVCLAVFLLGRWFQQVAGEATETFRCIAEAQYINLLEECKRDRQADDLALLYRRILARSADPLETRAGVRELSAQVVAGEAGQEQLPPGSIDPNSLARWGDLERIGLLYRDHLDGGVLHQTDAKTSEQLLGNLALQNIRDERFGIDRRERKRLARLDLSQNRGLSFGPHMWFQAITGSLSEQTAKLLLEYDRNAIPLSERSRYSVTEIEQFAAWLRDSSNETDNAKKPEGDTVVDLTGDTRLLRTTQFTALHFMAADPHRDALVRAEFGASVHERMCRDRRAMIRHVFGHFPYEQIPRSRRTFNPYDFYWRHLGGARIVLAPFGAFYLAGRLVLKALRLTARTVRSLLDPTRASGAQHEASASIEVAHRKIARMRRPVYMECLDLRSRFDPEYLGCRIPHLAEPPDTIACIEQDLAFIKADVGDYRRYESRRNMARARLERLDRHLVSRSLDDSGIRSIQRRRHTLPDDPPPPDTSLPSLEDSRRALAIAYVIDYRSLRTRLHLEDDLRALLREAVRRRGRPPESAAPHDTCARPRRRPRLANPFSPTLRRGLDLAITQVLGGLPPSERGYCKSYVKEDVGGLRRMLETLWLDGDLAEARRRALETRDDILSHPRLWRRQLITLRALQTLAVMDLRNDRDAVESLGGLTE